MYRGGTFYYSSMLKESTCGSIFWGSLAQCCTENDRGYTLEKMNPFATLIALASHVEKLVQHR